MQQRNLLVTGQNIYQIADPYHPKDPLQWDSNLVAGQFGASRSHAKNPDKKIQAYHMIVSFSDQEFPPEGNQKQEAKQATQLVKGFLGKYFPENAQDLITIQRDGRGGKLHAHIAVNSLLTSGKCIRTNLMTQMERKYTDSKGKEHIIPGFRASFNQYLEDNFEKVTGRKFQPVVPSTENRVHAAEEQIVARGSYDWHQDLKDRIYKAFSDPKVHSLDDFKVACATQGVTVTEKRRGTGEKGAQGHKVYKIEYTYSFIGEDKYKSGAHKGEKKLHKICDYRMGKDGKALRGSLGTAFTPENIKKEILNHEFIKEERVQRTQQARATESATNTIEGINTELTADLQTTEKAGTANSRESSEESGSIPITTSVASVESHSSDKSDSYQPSSRKWYFNPPRRLRYIDPELFRSDSDQMETLNENIESALKSLTDVQKQLLNVTDSLLGKPELTASDSKSTHTGSKTELPTGGTLSSLIATLETLSDYLESLPSKDQLGLLTQNLGQLLQRIDEVQK